MLRIVGVSLILVGLGWLTSEMPAAPRSAPSPTIPWRHTCNGWERAVWLDGELPHQPPALHPAVFGAVQLLFALAALIGLTPAEHFAAGSNNLAPGGSYLAPGEYTGG